MKKMTFLTLTVIILLSAHQVSAANEVSQQKSAVGNQKSEEKKNGNSNRGQEIEVSDADISVIPSVTTTPNLDTEEWKNHGQYVRGVAQAHPGGKTVSEAARSSIGKKSATTLPSISPSVSPTATPSVSVSPLPTEDPEATPSPTLTATPIPTDVPSEQVTTLIATLQSLIATLKNIFNL